MSSYRVYGAVDGLDATATRRPVEFQVAIFELQCLLHIPVRKLSLGQRMRCKVAGSVHARGGGQWPLGFPMMPETSKLCANDSLQSALDSWFLTI